jgi:DNA polymerase-4
MEKRVYFHIDVNSAFLSWEAVDRLEKGDESTVDIRNIPSAIGGDVAKRHGIVLAKSIPAKKYGIVTGESISEALKKCPSLFIAPPNHKLYQKYSEAFIKILEDYSPDIEQFSVDEAFIDVTGTRRLFGEPVALAHTIKDRIRDELGFTVNIGISDVKLLAKMASDFKKPDMIHTLYFEEIEQKMWPLPVEDLFYVGKSTKDKLYTMGIRTIGELANTDKKILVANLKSHGELIWNIANGIDISNLHSKTDKNKGYGNSTTVAVDITESESARIVLLSLCETVAKRLRVDKVKGELITVTIKDNNFQSYSHQKQIDYATNSTSDIFEYAMEIFNEMWEGTPIRLLGVSAGKLQTPDQAVQLSLFDDDIHIKREACDVAIDKIREKFGKDAIKRATYLDTNKEK